MRAKILCLMLFFLSVFGCSAPVSQVNNDHINNPISESPKLEDVKIPQAPGSSVKSDDVVLIDYSNIKHGYIQAKTKTANHKKLKIQVIKEEVTYNYDLNFDDIYETYPLNMGDGHYIIRALENIEDTRYALLFEFEVDVELENELYPYLYPNQVSNYDKSTQAVIKSFEITQSLETELERVQAIYDYIVSNIDYDWGKVDEVKGVYVLPVVDETLESESGICFDYAALMTSMLRSQNIPTKLVTGYVDEGYHAWIEVYISNIGWIAPHVYFEEEYWTLVDPTFDSLNKNYKGSYETKYTY